MPRICERARERTTVLVCLCMCRAVEHTFNMQWYAFYLLRSVLIHKQQFQYVHESARNCCSTCVCACVLCDAGNRRKFFDMISYIRSHCVSHLNGRTSHNNDKFFAIYPNTRTLNRETTTITIWKKKKKKKLKKKKKENTAASATDSVHQIAEYYFKLAYDLTGQKGKKAVSFSPRFRCIKWKE